MLAMRRRSRPTAAQAFVRCTCRSACRPAPCRPAARRGPERRRGRTRLRTRRARDASWRTSEGSRGRPACPNRDVRRKVSSTTVRSCRCTAAVLEDLRVRDRNPKCGEGALQLSWRLFDHSDPAWTRQMSKKRNRSASTEAGWVPRCPHGFSGTGRRAARDSASQSGGNRRATRGVVEEPHPCRPQR